MTSGSRFPAKFPIVIIIRSSRLQQLQVLCWRDYVEQTTALMMANIKVFRTLFRQLLLLLLLVHALHRG